jgi:hypothetical protein
MSFIARGWLAPQASLFVLCALGVGCMTQGPSSSDEPVSARKQGVSVQRDPNAPATEVALVRQVDSGYEIELQSPHGFAPRAFDPLLRIGGQEFRRYRESESVGIYGVVYALSTEEFQGLEDGSTVSVGYGPSPNAARSYGNLNKGALSVVK